MNDDWTYRTAKGQYGPYTISDIVDMDRAGRFKDGDLFWSRDTKKWITLEEFRRRKKYRDRQEQAAEKDYFVLSGDQQFGPFKQEELIRGAKAGQFSGTDRVIRDDWSETIPIDRVAQFALRYVLLSREQGWAKEGFVDLNGEGTADAFLFDTDNDGRPDALLTDVDGDGHFDVGVFDVNHDGVADLVAIDVDADGVADVVGVDVDGDGEIDAIGVDAEASMEDVDIDDGGGFDFDF